jgi:hypothetical protein
MIKLFKVKEKQREIAENANGKTPVKKQSAGELRLHRGMPCQSYTYLYFYISVVSFKVSERAANYRSHCSSLINT